ncbi:MAG: kinesin family protein, partial [archaeon]|nr:kinesin family protein [archaeon]
MSWTTDGLHLISGVSGSSCGSSAAKADSYRFDRVFHQSCTTQDVYRGAAQDIVRSCLDGMNGTVFAYGQTSTGKTHTMMGTNGSGVIPMSVRHIFELVAERDTETEYLLRVSYLEIYDEQICDLLEPSNKPVVRAEARPSDSDGGEMGVGIFGLKEESVTSAEALLEHMREGERNRRIGKTNMNEESSRSHAIFRIVIESRQRQAAADVRVSMLTLVDLAGSENTQKAGTAGVRAREGQAINKSLLALSNVINALAKGQAFVPYRNSALTRILQPALGGNSRTAIICTVALSQHHRSETHSTLKFASRAANVRNKPIVNVIVDDSARLVVLRREIQALKDQLKANTATREALIMEESTAEGDEDVAGDKTTGVRSAELIAKIEEQEAIRTEQEAKIHRLEALIVNSGSTATAESTKTEGKKQALRRGTVCASTFSFWSMGGAASSCNSDESTHAAAGGGPTLLSNAPPALIDFDGVSPSPQDHNHHQGQCQQSGEPKDGEGSKGSSSEYFSLLREKSGL